MPQCTSWGMIFIVRVVRDEEDNPLLANPLLANPLLANPSLACGSLPSLPLAVPWVPTTPCCPPVFVWVVQYCVNFCSCVVLLIIWNYLSGIQFTYLGRVYKLTINNISEFAIKYYVTCFQIQLSLIMTVNVVKSTYFITLNFLVTFK